MTTFGGLPRQNCCLKSSASPLTTLLESKRTAVIGKLLCEKGRESGLFYLVEINGTVLPGIMVSGTYRPNALQWLGQQVRDYPAEFTAQADSFCFSRTF